MRLNDEYCKLLDFDFGYDNKALADKLEVTSDDFAIGFAEWFRDYQWNGLDYSVRQLLEIYKIQKGL